MKFIIALVTSILLCSSLWAQDYIEKSYNQEIELEQIQREVEESYEGRDKGRGTGYKIWKRWEYNAQRSLDAEGKVIKPWEAAKRAQQFQDRYGESQRAVSGDYTDLGPTSAVNTSTWSSHLGRVTGIGLDPNDPDHLIITSETGGVWKTTDFGGSWTPLYDEEVRMNLYSAAISPSNSDHYLVGTTGQGLRRSTDGGMTWVNTNGEVNNENYLRIEYHPTNPDTVYAVGEWGGRVYVSDNGGANWDLIHDHNQRMYDLELKPGTPSTLYASGRGFILKSTDGGMNFDTLVGPWNALGNIMMAVTPHDPDYLYALQDSSGGLRGVYLSTDAGATWSVQLSNQSGGFNYLGYNPATQSGQAPRDMDICVSSLDKTEVHLAGTESWKSFDSGLNYSESSSWLVYDNSAPFIHADVDLMLYKGDTLFAGTDGGIFYSTDGANSFTDITPGLGIRQFYRIGVSQTDPDRVSGGSQDNGTGVLRDGVWYDWLGADGMETFISWADEDVLFGTSQFGGLYKSVNGGNSTVGVTNPGGSGNWVTPLEQDPLEANTLYMAKAEIYKSTDLGVTWDTITNFANGDRADELKIAPSDNQIMYVAYNGNLSRSDDGGVSWADRSPPEGNINYITIHPDDPDRVALALSGSSWKYAESLDGGQNWSNITANLPNITAQCILYENLGNGGMYAGMTPGVYYRDSSTTNWSSIQLSLPNVDVREFEIAHNTLYVGTYGRGLWKIDLTGDVGYTCQAPFAVSADCADMISAPAIDQSSGASQGGATNALWYQLTASEDMTINIRSCGAGKNTRLWVHEGSCGSLTTLASSDDDCDAGNGQGVVAAAIYDLDLSSGQKILIEWDDRWSSEAFDWYIERVQYSCEAAEVLTAAGTYTADGPDQCFTASHKDDPNADHANWFEFIPPQTGEINVASCGGGVDTRLYLHTGECGSLMEIASNDDICEMSAGSQLWASEVTNVPVIQGQSVWIEWDDRWSTSGFDFGISYGNTDPCPVDYDDMGEGQLAGIQNHDADHESNGLIDSEQIIKAGADVTYDSGVGVELLSNFEIEIGAVLQIIIDGCGNLAQDQEMQEEK